MFKLKYGNTNTYLIHGKFGNLLIDTDYAGTLPAFYKEIKKNNIKIKDIRYVLATHYHPDHIGLIGVLVEQGVKLILIDVQVKFINFSDNIFARNKLSYMPIDQSKATVLSCAESKNFLSSIGIHGEIIHTPSHSADSISLILYNGNCFVGDLEPFEYFAAYKTNTKLKKDWEYIFSFCPKKIFYAHMPEKILN